ncbi:MAG: CRISPR-associated RAMP protein Csx7 [Promethearchaeota archaeon]
MNQDIESGADHHILKNRIIIRGILNLQTALHIGGGESNIFGPEGAIITTHYKKDDEFVHGIPFIPATTLKGVIRSEAERIARSKDQSVCFSDEKDMKACKKNYCIICQIFGGQNLAAHVFFKDCFPTEETRTKLKPGVAIDRKTAKAKTGAVFFIYTLQPGINFDFEMIIENIQDRDRLNILKFLIRELSEGWIQIGGKRSVGLGKVKLGNIEIFQISSLNALIDLTVAEKISLDQFLQF